MVSRWSLAEIKSWPALCTVYVGRDLPSALGTVDASDFDLEIMNRTGDQFLKERSVRWVSGTFFDTSYKT